MLSRRTLPPFVFCLLVFSSWSVTTTHAQPASELVLHVAPGGADHWSGKLAKPDGGSDGPLASLQGARDRIRRAAPVIPSDSARSSSGSPTARTP